MHPTASLSWLLDVNVSLGPSGKELVLTYHTDMAEKTKEPPPARLKTEPTTINERNSSKGEKWSPLHERIPTSSSTRSRTTSGTQGTLDAPRSFYTLRVPRPTENANGHQQQSNTPTTRNRWNPIPINYDLCCKNPYIPSPAWFDKRPVFTPIKDNELESGLRTAQRSKRASSTRREVMTEHLRLLIQLIFST